MKKVTKFFMAALLAGMCSFGYAQTQVDYMKPPKLEEKVIGTVSGEWWIYRNDDRSKQEVYEKLLTKAKEQYQGIEIDIRGMNYKYLRYNSTPPCYRYEGSGKVVDLHDMETLKNAGLSQALNKALRNVREGSRLAIDQVTVTGSMDRESLKDQLLDVLLDKGYRVVAKEYLEKLYDEIKDQGSGIYNDGTTVKPDNFSAVGYYINVKVTETSLRVQVVNVSTGEYEGNATVNF
ncbi:MAG: hypothetical protein IKI09_08145 [Bacteroidales bacterium]|nr:hypothetical protein [Bacteroidales bacterium]